MAVDHTPCNGYDCPDADRLTGLIRGRLPDAEQVAITDHVGECTGCQHRMDEIAGGELSDVVRHVDRDAPASDSAYWSALRDAEDEVAALAVTGPYRVARPGPAAATPLPAELNRSGELKLDFLTPSPTPGRLGMLGQFDVVRVVGRGGMGVVLHAFDPCLQRDVAVKILDPQLANDDTARQRFCREARAAAAVTHENLVAVHQVDEDEASGLPYLVMQLIVGESLDERLRKAGRMGVRDVARLGMQAAAGLAAAHAGGLIHRDIKPGNILLEAGTDRVKLTDFGLARAAEDVKLTRTGLVAGTPLYMAPEQARGEEVDHRADLFSLGSVLYEAATGKPPFDGKTPLAVLRRVSDDAHPPLSALNPSTPEWLIEVIDKLLAKKPADRFQTAAEVADVFAAQLACMTAADPRVSATEQPCPLSRTAAAVARKGKAGRMAVRLAPIAFGVLVGGLAVAAWLGRPAATTPVPQPLPLAAPVADNAPPPLAVFPGNAGSVWAVDFTPDGQTLVIGTEDGSIRLWDVPTRTVRRTLARQGGNVWTLAVSPEGNRVAAALDSSTEVKVWDLVQYKAVKSLPQGTAARSAAFSPDGRALAVGDREAKLWIWCMEKDEPCHTVAHAGVVNAVAFAPGGDELASVSSAGTVKVWSLDSAKPRLTMEEHQGPVYGVAYSPDGAALATAGWDKTVRVWDAKNGGQVHVLRGHTMDVWSVAFGSGGRLASGSGDGTVKVWDAASGRELLTLKTDGSPVHVVRFARDGRTLAVGTRDGNVRLWELP